MENQRITIDETTYELRPWSYKDGRRWLYRLVGLLASASAHDGRQGQASESAAIGAVIASVDEETFEAFADTCEKYTDLVSRGEDGGERVQALSKVASVHMRGRYVDMVVLMRAHIEAQFSDFFARVGELLGAGADSTGTEAK